MKRTYLSVFALVAVALVGCAEAEFSGGTTTAKSRGDSNATPARAPMLPEAGVDNPPAVDPTMTQQILTIDTPDPVVTPPPLTPPPVIPPVVPLAPVACSSTYSTPGMANPFLAGMPSGTSINYVGHGVDIAPGQSPRRVSFTDPTCLNAGSRLKFEVSGGLGNGGGFPIGAADGNLNSTYIATTHLNGATYGKSNIVAPMSSLVGVFLADNVPTVAPPTLSFVSSAERNYTSLSPEIGQIFYIGDGMTDSGVMQEVIVPAGATRFFFGVNDSFEWNNNQGSVQGRVLVQP